MDILKTLGIISVGVLYVAILRTGTFILSKESRTADAIAKIVGWFTFLVFILLKGGI